MGCRSIFGIEAVAEDAVVADELPGGLNQAPTRMRLTGIE